MNPADEARFWAKVNFPADVMNGCWEWKASLGTTGYGQFMFKKVPRKAHRVAYELTKGPISPGLVLDHWCCYRLTCVNPWHLRAVTDRQNTSNFRNKSQMSSQFTGVSWDKRVKRWKSQIYFNGKTHNLGHFSTEAEASVAYQAKLATL